MASPAALLAINGQKSFLLRWFQRANGPLAGVRGRTVVQIEVLSEGKIMLAKILIVAGVIAFAVILIRLSGKGG